MFFRYVHVYSVSTKNADTQTHIGDYISRCTMITDTMKRNAKNLFEIKSYKNLGKCF